MFEFGFDFELKFELDFEFWKCDLNFELDFEVILSNQGIFVVTPGEYRRRSI